MIILTQKKYYYDLTAYKTTSYFQFNNFWNPIWAIKKHVCLHFEKFSCIVNLIVTILCFKVNSFPACLTTYPNYPFDYIFLQIKEA